ncbi:MAG: holo-ACP synthase [Firmicutes bacterium]|nr:holo-ACP synthase [Bacillota bacterium]
MAVESGDWISALPGWEQEMRVGVDLVDIARLSRVLSRSPSFARKVFTPSEVAIGESLSPGRRIEFLAGRFAAKEAALKALGTGALSVANMTDVEILRGTDGAPKLVFYGKAREIMSALGVREGLTSISHDCDKAVAVVVLV